MKSNQYQADREKLLSISASMRCAKALVIAGRLLFGEIKKQTPDSSIPPLRAAAIADDLYKKPAHVCKRNVAGFVGARQQAWFVCDRCRVYYLMRKIINFSFVKYLNKSV